MTIDQNWAITVFSVCIPLAVAIFKLVPRRRDDVATWRELQQLRTDMETKFERMDTRFDTLHRDVTQIAISIGKGMLGS